MAAEEAAPDLDDLIAGSFVTKSSRECWAETIDGPFADYIGKLREAHAQGQRPVWKRVQEIAAENFGVAMSWETLRRHISGECRCEK